MSRSRWLASGALLLDAFLFAYAGGISARALDATGSIATPGLASVSGSAQCGTVSLPGASVQLFNGAGLVAASTADAAAQFTLPPAAPGVYTVRVRSGGTVCGYQVSIKSTVSAPDLFSGLFGDASISTLAASTGARCPADSRNNHSWVTASPLDALSSTAPATVAAMPGSHRHPCPPTRPGPCTNRLHRRPPRATTRRDAKGLRRVGATHLPQSRGRACPTCGDRAAVTQRSRGSTARPRKARQPRRVASRRGSGRRRRGTARGPTAPEHRPDRGRTRGQVPRALSR